MHVSVSGLRAQKSTFFGPGPALDFSRNGLRISDGAPIIGVCLRYLNIVHTFGISSVIFFAWHTILLNWEGKVKSHY